MYYDRNFMATLKYENGIRYPHFLTILRIILRAYEVLPCKLNHTYNANGLLPFRIM